MVFQDMKDKNKHLANTEDDKNWVVKYPLTFKFCAELSGVLNSKPEFEVPHDYDEIVHEDPLEPSCKCIQNSKPSCNVILEILIFC